MKRLVILLTAAVLITLPLNSAVAKTVIKLANAGPEAPDNRTVKAVKVFKYLVEKGTNGEVEIQAFHARKLGDEREALEGIRMGTIQMGTLTSGPVPGFLPTVMLYDIPFLFSSAPAAWEFFESKTAQEFKEAFLEKSGVRILATSENGYRHFTDTIRPIKTPQDMKGLKIRTMQNPAHMSMVKALGADPTPLPFGELYMALQQKVVDGMECPIVLINDMKFYEVQKYMVLDGHLYNPLFIFINDQFFTKKLTPAQQTVVLEAAKVLARTHNGFSQEANIQGLSVLKAKGMEVYKPTLEELAQFRALAQPAGLEFITDKIGKEWVEKTLKDADEAEKVVGDRADAIIDETIKYANDMLSQVK
ncbi:DctP9 [Desulforapulum autotrophicum HRM2]|uniref:DctP9 n=1 Tax=Desulforapulum autotrophicum (strain ATCC 43914 / DSM 3382 / VKM B-1955 / HRM2) TaxID=177437 RepID=C0QDR9_DESAH|nr:DctP family TRAP transporter solute-binding subunit [Desulforapulum autotrophicum]ACN17340.1 DctP9 [Desulforapulum autotrophicum HRM2]